MIYAEPGQDVISFDPEGVIWMNLFALDGIEDVLVESQQHENWKHWKHNVFKFARKVWAQCHAAEDFDGYLFWVDADTYFTKPIERSWLTSCIEGASMCIMARHGFHPCTSFVGWDCSKPDTKDFFKLYKHLYESGDVYKLDEQHDAYILDYCRLKLKVRTRDLCANTLKAYMHENVFDLVVPGGKHLKGLLKNGSFSDG